MKDVRYDLDRWYPLDGTWHPSVATKMSRLHAPASEKGCGALCRPQVTVLLEDCDYDTAEALRCGRELCGRCVQLKIKAAAARKAGG